MSDEQDAQRWFAAALGDEPARPVDVDAAVRTGEQRLRHRRMWAVGGVAAAVTVAVVGVGLGTRLFGSSIVTPASVPGCASVVSTTDPAYLGWKTGSGAVASTSSSELFVAEERYAGENSPAWATDEYRQRAVAAAVSALPSGVVQFTPTPSPDDHGADGAPGGEYWSGSRTTLTVQAADGNRQSGLSLILMGPWTGGPPPCAESVLYRLTTADGTVVDVRPFGDSGLLAEAFFADGSLTQVELLPSTPGPDQGQGQLPMTPEQLAAVAASPGLSVTG